MFKCEYKGHALKLDCWDSLWDVKIFRWAYAWIRNSICGQIWKSIANFDGESKFGILTWIGFGKFERRRDWELSPPLEQVSVRIRKSIRQDDTYGCLMHGATKLFCQGFPTCSMQV
jgi:hypothetical protein